MEKKNLDICIKPYWPDEPNECECEECMREKFRENQKKNPSLLPPDFVKIWKD